MTLNIEWRPTSRCVAEMMRFVLRILVMLVVLPSALLLLGFAGYDLFVYQPRKLEISVLIAKATADERALSPQVTKILYASLHNHLSAHTARILLFQSPTKKNERAESSHLTYFLWTLLVALHLNTQEKTTVLAARLYSGHGQYGLSNGAMHYFHKPLSMLSVDEAALLVARTMSPSASTAPLMQIRDKLLTEQ